MKPRAAQTQLAFVDETPQPRPFLKWAGGKGQLLEQFQPLLPPLKGRYFEPFVGGAALFFSLQSESAVLSDVNEELIDCYRAVRDDVEGVIAALGEHRYAPDHFYAVRSIDPATLPLAKRAARTIYLNRTGFNGLYRVNRSGKFNVPIGRYTNPLICDAKNLRACSCALSGVGLEVLDFGKVVAAAKAGDFVYFDPPYVPLSDTAYFTSYVPGGFGLEEQKRLATDFANLAAEGVYVMLSNSDTPTVRDLYEGFRIDVVLASRNINSNSARRGKVGEVVVRNFVERDDKPFAKRRRSS
jgi:DNA adenine methylase